MATDPQMPPDYAAATQDPAKVDPGQYPPPQYPPPAGQYPPPGGQYPPPQGQQVPPTYVGTTTTIVTQPATMSNAVLRFSEYPTQIVCPHCQAQIVTTCEYTPGVFAFLMCSIIFLVGCWLGCCLIPFCVEGMKDVTHTCPNCHKVVGVYRRM